MLEKIIVLDPITPDRADDLRALLPDGFYLEHGNSFDENHLKEIISDADYAISGQIGVSGEVLKSATKLKLLHKWGVGVDNFDLNAAKQLGIKVARTTGSNALSVAEYTLGLMISSLRGIGYGNFHLKLGDWRGITKLPTPTYQVSGKTIGIIGFGAIGQNLARLLRSFDVKILYSKRTPLKDDNEFRGYASLASIDEILQKSDIISLHCPLTEDTANLIGSAQFDKMKSNALLINVARGGVVDEAALIDALLAKKIFGAAMDVFEIEPLPKDSPLYKLDNLLITPHLGAVTKDTFEPTVRRMFENISLNSRGLPIPENDIVL